MLDVGFIPYGTDSEKDKFVDDKSLCMHKYAIKIGYGFDKLYKTTPYPAVKAEIIRKGYYLDALIKDSPYVKAEVLHYLDNSNYKNLEDWIAKNPDKCAFPENKLRGNECTQRKITKDMIFQNTQISTKTNSCSKGER